MSLKQSLTSGATTFGCWITLGHPAIAEIMSKAGFDWLTVDMEHSTIDLAQAGELIRVIDLAGRAPLVRLPSHDPFLIKRLMDAGAHGIIAPFVNTADQARLLGEAMCYPPRGVRGVGLARAQTYGASFAEYKCWQESEPVLIVQVEHIEAVHNLEEILAVPAVDGYIVGPYDLSASLGRPGDFENPEFLEAMATIERVGPASGKVPGIHIVEPSREQLAQRIEQGYRFVAYSLDIRMLDVECREALAQAHSLKKS